MSEPVRLHLEHGRIAAVEHEDGFLASYTGPRPLRGQPRIAQSEGRCTICGQAIRAGEDYLWSWEHSRGAHVGCGTLEKKR